MSRGEASTAKSARRFQQILPPQVLFNPSPDSPADGLGYLAAARNLIRLNTISPALFPLPHALAREAAGADEDIDLPDGSSEDTPGKEPASQQDEHQHLYMAAGVSHAVVHSTSHTGWSRLESFEPLDIGEGDLWSLSYNQKRRCSAVRQGQGVTYADSG